MDLRRTVRRGYGALGDAYAHQRGDDDHLDRAVGLDFSREQLRLAGERLPAAARVQGTLAALPFRDGSFDAVTACNSLIHVPREDHPAVLAEFARVLRPGGRLLLTEGTVAWEGENPDWMGSGVSMAWSIAGREATVAALEAAGFALLAEWVVGDDTAKYEDARTPYVLARLC